MKQTPAPDFKVIKYKGDIFEVSLELDHPQKGSAWLRTNLLHAREYRSEIIDHVENDAPLLAHDWHDYKMTRKGDRHFVIKLPLLDVGWFEAKSFFLPEGSSEPVWPHGGNITIKVEPASYCAGNSIYTAFVRLFNSEYSPPGGEEKSALDLLDSKKYTVIPRSGTFRELTGKLDLIIDKMHFKIIQLLPIHPVPTTYARMGMFGSPFAVLDYYNIDAGMAEFDKKTTPLDQFRELIDAVHARNARIFMDIPLNHTGWASRLQIHHPAWFNRDNESRFESPGAWGVTWEDLSKLDYRNKDLWKYMANVFIYWCKQGIDGFRCDAGYMIPKDAWQYITSRVRDHFPDTIFLLENLGGPAETMYGLLSRSNLNWGYSELFQAEGRRQIEEHMKYSDGISMSNGTLVNFAETHDNNRLAARSKKYARLRTVMAALSGHNGAFGITCGVEWFADAKIMVHGISSMNWGSKENQVGLISTLNAITATHPAFHHGASVKHVNTSATNTLAFLRQSSGGEAVLVVMNLDDLNNNIVSWPVDSLDNNKCLYDLISGKQISVQTRDNRECFVELLPMQYFCLTADAKYAEIIDRETARRFTGNDADKKQMLKAIAIDIYSRLRGSEEAAEQDTGDLAAKLDAGPESFISDLIGPDQYCPVTRWHYPMDLRRKVVVPRGNFLIIDCETPFRASLQDSGGILETHQSIQYASGRHMVICLPLTATCVIQDISISIISYGETNKRAEGKLLLLDSIETPQVRTSYKRAEIRSRSTYALCTNERGAMSYINADFGEIKSQYDCLLAGNMHPSCPVDRLIMLTRMRAWLVYQGYSSPINIDSLEYFSASNGNSASWRFNIPCGKGKSVEIDISLKLSPDKNAVSIDIDRIKSKYPHDMLDDDIPVKIILRFDIENRSFHEKTKAYAVNEDSWRNAVNHSGNEFVFSPAPDRNLKVQCSKAAFTFEPEWYYMINHPVDNERGLDGSSDLFSPGYFSVNLKTGDNAKFLAGINGDIPASPSSAVPAAGKSDRIPLSDALKTAIDQFIVKRDDHKTVIAGYPWFLDWGRDTLICLRGIIESGRIKEAEQILIQFAGFEKNGTIPNMIHGEDASNRDTSDAPLWLSVACSDFIRKTGRRDILDSMCRGRSLRDILISIAESYIAGTYNGIKMDPESRLIYSPSHFTWMDTNHPAGSPRQGYPVEIQALWHAALRFLSEIDSNDKWRKMKDDVRSSIQGLFFNRSTGSMSDCLHAKSFMPASKAAPDDAARPNQLLAVTLRAVDDIHIQRAIIRSCEQLLIPGAIRSLADEAVKYPLPIYHDNHLLNEPYHPYWGYYTGDENTGRKPAYHNGTGWTWLFPSYCEALYIVHGESAKKQAFSILSSSLQLLDKGCICQIPELVDGNLPHKEKGCSAQAWGVTELYRVLELLKNI